MIFSIIVNACRCFLAIRLLDTRRTAVGRGHFPCRTAVVRGASFMSNRGLRGGSSALPAVGRTPPPYRPHFSSEPPLRPPRFEVESTTRPHRLPQERRSRPAAPREGDSEGSRLRKEPREGASARASRRRSRRAVCLASPLRLTGIGRQAASKQKHANRGLTERRPCSPHFRIPPEGTAIMRTRTLDIARPSTVDRCDARPLRCTTAAMHDHLNRTRWGRHRSHPKARKRLYH